MNMTCSDKNTFAISPVGYVENDLVDTAMDFSGEKDPEKRKKQLIEHQQMIQKTASILTILPEYEPLLDGIEGYSHIVVFFWPHLLPEEKRSLKKVHPRGWKDIPMQGIFATRSPARPNPILISTVPLVKRDGRHLHVTRLEAFNNSPIIDIKPVVRACDYGQSFRVPDWIRQTHDDEVRPMSSPARGSEPNGF